MKRCPLCERPMEGQIKAPPLWRKVKRYADGTRTNREIAKIIGSTPGTVRLAMYEMRRLGMDVRASKRSPEYKPSRDDYAQFTTFRAQGLTWQQIGKLLGISQAAAFKKGRQIMKVYGVLPGRMRKRPRNNAQDYRKIRELRVDAQLPWKMVGKAVGMNQQYVARYFAELCKTYGN